jgi:hypothetical protein
MSLAVAERDQMDSEDRRCIQPCDLDDEQREEYEAWCEKQDETYAWCEKQNKKVDRMISTVRELERPLSALTSAGVSREHLHRLQPTLVLRHHGRVTLNQTPPSPGWPSRELIESVKRAALRMARDFGSGAPLVGKAIEDAFAAFGPLWSFIGCLEYLAPDEARFSLLLTRAVEALEKLERTLGIARHMALCARVPCRSQKVLILAAARSRPVPSRRTHDLYEHDPPGQVIVTSSHLTNGPPPFPIVAFMRRTEALS